MPDDTDPTSSDAGEGEGVGEGEGEKAVYAVGPDGVEEMEDDVWESLAKARDSQQEDTTPNTGPPNWYRPAYDPGQLVTLLDRSETHAACVHAKSQGVAGYGFQLVPHESVDDGDDPPGYDTLTEFWREGTFQLGPDEQPATATDVLEHGWTDYESVGWGALELLVNSQTGDPTGLAHVPAHTIRARKDAPGYLQLNKGGMPIQYFGAAGDRYQTEDGSDQTFVDAESGDVSQTTGDVDTVANELIIIRNYSAIAPHYGTPDIIPAMGTVAGNIAARQYNARFFENDGVPRFAVIVEGGELSEKSWTEIEKTLKNLTKEENTHRGMLVEATNAITEDSDLDVNIRIEPLTVGVEEDASFIEYRKENEVDIRKAHSVPPVVLERTENVNYSNASSQRKEFAQTTIRPRQQKYASRLYQTIHAQAFEIPEWTIEFDLHGGENQMRQAEIATTRIKDSKGVMTVNEAREELGLDPMTDDNGEPLPQGEQLLATLGGGGSQFGGALEDALQQHEEETRSEERAEMLGYSIADRMDGLPVDD